MTFFLKRKEVLRNKPTRIVFVLVAAAAVIFGGYVLALAILAPEQLAEATAAATDLVCSGCVGTTDIANSAVTSAKIGSGHVKNSDIGSNAVTSPKILDGQVGNVDLGPSAVTSPKIKDFEVGNGDLGTDSVTTAKIKNGEVKTEDIANDAVKPNVHRVVGSVVVIPPDEAATAIADCPPGEILTGGGFSTNSVEANVFRNYPADENTWYVQAYNPHAISHSLSAYALCTGPFP